MLLNQAITQGIPCLENGDRLSRPEFERRYSAMPQVKKAELIEGIVYMPSPVRARQHGRPHALIMSWLGVYWAATPGVDLCDNTTIKRGDPNSPTYPFPQTDEDLREMEEILKRKLGSSGDAV